MKNYSQSSYYNQCNSSSCEIISGNNVDIEINRHDCEVRADIIVSRTNSVRIWGQVRDCEGNPVANAQVKLVKPVNNCGRLEYQGISHSVTDCNGFYQFDIEVGNGCNENNYKILVGKSVVGKDRIVSTEGSCNTCESPCPPKQKECPPKVEPCNYEAQYPKTRDCKSTNGKCREVGSNKHYVYYCSE